VVLATGAPADRPLGVPGEDLPGVVGSAAFVGWYNGHPDFADLDPPLASGEFAVIGNGNVALDVARILAKTPAEFEGSDIVGHALDALAAAPTRHITIVGRRGPHQIGMTPKELGELGHLERARPVVEATDLPPVEADAALDPGQRKSVGHLRSFAAPAANGVDKPVTLSFDFFARPVAVEGEGKVERLIVERTKLDESGNAVGTGEIYAIPCGMVVAAIGYKTTPIPGVPYDDKLGRFANQDGRISPGLYAVGWARRGPTGTIGTNRPDGFLIAETIAADQPEPTGKQGRPGLDALLVSRNVVAVTFRDWQKIDSAEISRARSGAPREKFTAVADMLGARG
jgi:ferredoxin--NADP+ reductase